MKMTERQLLEACKDAHDAAATFDDGISAVIQIVRDQAAEFPEVDPTRLEAMRLAVQWTQAFNTSPGQLDLIVRGIERHLRGGHVVSALRLDRLTVMSESNEVEMTFVLVRHPVPGVGSRRVGPMASDTPEDTYVLRFSRASLLAWLDTAPKVKS